MFNAINQEEYAEQAPYHWRKFNGDRIVRPIKTEVEEAIQRETEAGNRLKVCIGTDSQVK
ncbi:MAG: hypothetical protein ACO29O_00825 [Chitinophagaceae bacterium]